MPNSRRRSSGYRPPIVPGPSAIREWFMKGLTQTPDISGTQFIKKHPTHPWWQVMCLTGVDYFSTLGYQPGIAFLAAGLLSPIATLVLVGLTLLGALPIYSHVAAESPHGQGSISMLESLLSRWKGKAIVLVLLGFAATDFVITITLSAADATAHIIENPYAPHWMEHPVVVTMALLLFLGAIFIKGFKEAIWLAVILVAAYLVLNVVIIARGGYEILTHPELFANWRHALMTGPTHGDFGNIAILAVLVFPKLALGLSGFETGVAVMPLVAGDPHDTHSNPVGRIRNTRKLLRTAALIMSVGLIGSSWITTLLIPPDAFQSGGPASGRALSYLFHRFYGDNLGTLYDLSTIAILWFAGASAMAGLLNLVPRYLPRYGMAPEWARALRPLVVVLTRHRSSIVPSSRARAKPSRCPSLVQDGAGAEREHRAPRGEVVKELAARAEVSMEFDDWARVAPPVFAEDRRGDGARGIVVQRLLIRAFTRLSEQLGFILLCVDIPRGRGSRRRRGCSTWSRHQVRFGRGRCSSSPWPTPCWRRVGPTRRARRRATPATTPSSARPRPS